MSFRNIILKKEFDKVRSYTYFIQRKKDGLKYHGRRTANIGSNRTPEEDFGKHYFTSGPFEFEFRENKSAFVYKIKHTFDSRGQAIDYEELVNNRLYNKTGWINGRSDDLTKKLRSTNNLQFFNDVESKSSWQNYLPIDHEAFSDRRLSPIDFIVFLSIVNFVDPKTLKCKLRYETISKHCGASIASVQRSVKRLYSNKYIDKKRFFVFQEYEIIKNRNIYLSVIQEQRLSA